MSSPRCLLIYQSTCGPPGSMSSTTHFRVGANTLAVPASSPSLSISSSRAPLTHDTPSYNAPPPHSTLLSSLLPALCLHLSLAPTLSLLFLLLYCISSLLHSVSALDSVLSLRSAVQMFSLTTPWSFRLVILEPAREQQGEEAREGEESR